VAVRDHELVACEGEWDISRAEEFARLGSEALASSRGVLILDFATATFVDASTVGAICALAREASKRGVSMAVTCDAPVVRRVFDLTHLHAVVPVSGTVEAALSMFRTGADAGSPLQEVNMGGELHGQKDDEERDPPARDDDVDEASEESFPASDPPSFGSAEPDGGAADDRT
jgi:anti-anti-sigma factor